MTGHRVLIEELWNPAQPQSQQRRLIPRDSFRFLPWLSGKTIFSESHSGQRSILPGMKVVSTDSQRICNSVSLCRRLNLSYRVKQIDLKNEIFAECCIARPDP